MSPSNIYHSPHFSFPPLVLTISFLFAGMNSAAAAEDSTPNATYIDTQPIVVTATRTTQPLSQAASSLSVLTGQSQGRLHLRQSGMAKERLRIRPLQSVGRRLWGFTP